MKFGGHETFHIRDSWLYRGLKLLNEDSQSFAQDIAADRLGVGGNMAKSIRHWMLATGLADKVGTSKDYTYRLSKLGGLIAEYDPYFTNLSTWWVLHINLVNNPTYALSWDWMFNHFGQQRFEKGVAVENLKRHLTYNTNHRAPAQKTLERDLGVLLNTYSITIPGDKSDPEDSKDCPFQALGIMNFLKESGSYRISYAEKNIQPEVLGYALVKALPDEVTGQNDLAVEIGQASTAPNGPGKVFCLRPESVFDLAQRAERDLEKGWISITGLAGSRSINFRAWQPTQWLEALYQRETEQEELWQTEDPRPLLAAY